MKSLIVAALLLLSTPAFAGNFVDDAHQCTYYATKATEYSLFAASDPKDMKGYASFVAEDIAHSTHSAKVQKWLADISQLAWDARKTDLPSDVGMAVYTVCLKQSGLTT